MTNFEFLNTMKNRSEKRAAANFLRGPQKCIKCDFFGLCYEKQKKNA